MKTCYLCGRSYALDGMFQLHLRYEHGLRVQLVRLPDFTPKRPIPDEGEFKLRRNFNRWAAFWELVDYENKALSWTIAPSRGNRKGSGIHRYIFSPEGRPRIIDIPAQG